MIRKHPVLTGLFVLLAAGVVAGVVLARRPKPLPVRTAAVERLESLAEVVRAPGEIRAHEMVDIQAEIAGVIVDLPVEEGQQVAKGQVLLRIDPFQTETELAGARARHAAGEAEVARMDSAIAAAEAGLAGEREQIRAVEAELAEARITLERDRAVLHRQRQLLEKQIVSEDDFELVEAKFKISEKRIDSTAARLESMRAMLTSAELGVKQQRALRDAAAHNLAAAKAALDRASDQFQKVTIPSPLDGVIVALNVNVGERAVPGIQSNPQATLMTIANLSVIEAELEVDETEIVRVHRDQPVKIEVDALPREPLAGHVASIGSAPIPSYSTGQEGKDFEVIVEIENAPDTLRVGMSCEAEITVATRESVPAVPIQALTAREVPVDEDDRYAPPAKPRGKRARTDNPAGAPAGNEGKKKELEGVFVADADGYARFRPVETGIMGETHVEIAGGLDEGEAVIVGPLASLRELDEWSFVKPEPQP